MYPRVEPEELKSLIEDSGVSFKKNSMSYIFDCPRCRKNDKLYIRQRDGRFVCWVCREVENFQGRPEYALAELLGLPLGLLQKRLYGRAVAPLATFFTLDIRDFFGDGDELDGDAEEEPLRETVFPPDFFPITDRRSAIGAAYLADRGISLELAEEYGLRYWPARRRVVFPVQKGGRLYGWQARTVENTVHVDSQGNVRRVPKMVSSKDMQGDRLLMFADRLEGAGHAVLCEGPIDAIKAHLCGGNVAAMGKSIPAKKIETLRRSGIKRVYLALDPDAVNDTARLARELADPEVFVMTPGPKYKDLGEMSPPEVFERFLVAEKPRAGRLSLHFQ